jgi:hypothetical protein
MKEFDKLPKSVKKAVRYIKQDAGQDQLEMIKKYVDQALSQRMYQKEKASNR